VILGVAFAPIYPSLVALTTARLGLRHARNAMGFQVAMATLGQAAIPGLIGVLARIMGYEAIAWSFAAAGMAAGACLIALTAADAAPSPIMSGNG
jgi:fucose permease